MSPSAVSKHDFTSVPILDYTLLSTPEGRKSFIDQLRHALIFVGFFYLQHPPVPQTLVQSLIDYIPKLFELPQDKKDRIRMANSPRFLGYSRFGAELTRGATDQREQYDFATEYKGQGDKEDEPEYTKLQGEPQWPDEKDIPGFKATITEYYSRLADLSYELTCLLSEALGLPPDGLSAFFEDREQIQHRGKIVKYPSPKSENDSSQGVGPHFDAGFLTLLLQASPHRGLQVQSLSGAWIDAPPLPDTLVINFGKGLEAVTRGLARATSHRVLSPAVGSTPRYSVPFFQRITQKVVLAEHIPEFSPEIMKLKEERGETGLTDSVNYAEYETLPSGQVELIGRVKSHPDVAERHYPNLFQQFFPQGIPKQVNVY
ncbi:iron/ascorbate oxidoreductase [Fomitiporia mediterranea MF3/22]|uniref:iron/ascorbate oxidoreductase n=1 Tax=Fomitiporia mediterranea (strain MF3/22) TaxID=694068 RepID=UPI0004409B57|nr:iron/ascorbate oxidoreductase [Fomitiporia mediterranea MF3/22]EJD02689.1 iron/ascorbate oxidoreductase [Fomitiporia mediterranea MF3/22]